jgi:predicted O-methyltransferase YrrM
VLWSGKVVAELKKIDKDTQAILDFNAFVQADNRVENVLFPIRDGLLIARKK